MKASEMTNEELAACIASARLAPAKHVREDYLNFHREAILEAAARLRRQDITIAAQKAKGAAEGYAHGCEETREKPSQVGNSAKMRDALSDACYAMFNFLKTQNGGYEEMAKALDKAKATLAEPTRNCDVGTAEEQLKRFIAFCLSRKCNECPFVSSTYGECGVRWSQMPYEGGAK